MNEWRFEQDTSNTITFFQNDKEVAMMFAEHNDEICESETKLAQFIVDACNEKVKNDS